MVDVISTRFQGMYGSWNYFNNNSNGNMMETDKKQEHRGTEEPVYIEEVKQSETRPEAEDSPPPGKERDSQPMTLSCRSCSPGQSVSVKCLIVFVLGIYFMR